MWLEGIWSTMRNSHSSERGWSGEQDPAWTVGLYPRCYCHLWTWNIHNGKTHPSAYNHCEVFSQMCAGSLFGKRDDTHSWRSARTTVLPSVWALCIRVYRYGSREYLVSSTLLEYSSKVEFQATGSCLWRGEWAYGKLFTAPQGSQKRMAGHLLHE